MKAKLEKCVLCGEETEYHLNDDINLRKYYIEGAGQLCKKCYDELYNKNKKDYTQQIK
jgi:recombinational DNA repair protein (RecF pathway)